MSRARGNAWVATLGLAVACTLPTEPAHTAPSGAPVNSCPTFPCSAYVQPGASPVCNGGVCLVSSYFQDLVVVVSLAEDSFFAPGRDFAIQWKHIFDPAATPLCDSGGITGTAPTGAETRPCTHLPGTVREGDSYLASPSTELAVSWNLGNPGFSTQLPAQVTFRPLWLQGSATVPVDAETVGLPLPVFPGVVSLDTSAGSRPGPNGGRALAFDVLLQPSPALYERVITPDPPFDQAFPPDVEQISRTGQFFSEAATVDLDTSTHVTTSGSRAIPAFHVTRVGGLAGWTMYLRDSVTKRRLSPVAHLPGAQPIVQLPTNHHPADGDAITGVELVIAPPSGQPIPTAVRIPSATQLPQEQPLQELPAAVTIGGAVVDADGATPVDADLVFEAMAIYETGTTTPNAVNYEYLARASARLDATGAATWSARLPAGQYRVSVWPLDATRGVTAVQSFDVQPSTTPRTAPNLMIAPQQRVTGSAAVADGRQLAGAQVEAIPAGCMLGQSPYCMPRGAQGTTSTDGSFVLTLDQGSYVLRIEPPASTALPWVTQNVLVGPTTVTLAPMVVGAPVYVGLVLHDGSDNPVVGAVVRAYDVPAKGPAVLLGRAVTDVTGHYDMFLSPSSH